MKFASNLTLLALALILSGCEEIKTALPAPPPPFAGKGQEKTSHFMTEVQGDSIVAGTKGLKMDKFGSVAFSADERAVGKFHLPVSITDKRTGTREYLSVANDAPKEAFSHSEQDAKDGKFTFKKTIVHQRKEAGISGRMEALPDGKIHLSYEWGDFSSPDFQLEPYPLMFDIPVGGAKSAGYDVDGKTGVFPDNIPATGKTIQVFDAFKTLEIFANSPACSIKISAGQNCGALVVGYNPHDCGYATFRISPKADDKHLSVAVDIGEGVPKQESQRTQGGINFKAVEDLELPDYPASRNFISNPSFECGTECYWHHGMYSWHVDPMINNWDCPPFELDAASAMFGAHSLRLRCSPKHGDFRCMGVHVRSFPVPLDKGTYCFSVYAKGEPSKAQRLSVWIPGVHWLGNANVHLPINSSYPKPGNDGATKVFALGSEWKRYSFNFALPGSMPVVVSLGADSADGQGHAWIDGLQLESGSEPTEFQTRPVEGWLRTASPGNFLDVNTSPEARLELSAAPGAAGTATITVKDFYGEEMFRHRQGFACDASGRAVVELPVEGKLPQGIFVLKAEYELADGTKSYDLHRLSIMKFLKGEHRLKDIFAEDYGRTHSRADFLQLLRRYREVGFGSQMQVQTWDKAVWDAYRTNKVTPTDAYTFTNAWPAPEGSPNWVVASTPCLIWLQADDPRILLGFPRFDAHGRIADEYLTQLKAAIAKVVREHPWVETWLAGNETPIDAWAVGGPRNQAFENLAKFQKAFAEGVKAGNPAAKTVSDQQCNMRPEGGIRDLGEELAALNRLGGPKFDYVGIHTYRSSPESPDLDADTKTYLEMLEKNGYADTPIYWGEGMHYGPYAIPPWHVESACWMPWGTWLYGTLSYDMGWTEKISAAWRARSWLVALKYQDHVRASMSGSGLNNFEMDLELTPFATQKIPNTLGNLLGDAYFKQDIRFAPYVRCYLFEDAEKRPVAAVWCHHPKLDAGTMAAPRAAAKLGDAVEAVFDLMQRERAYTPDADGVFEFPVSSFPAFFRGKPGALAAFAKAFENASLVSGEDIAPLALVAKPASPTMVEIKARNYLSKAFEGALSLPGGGGTPLSVPASGLDRAELKLPVTLDYAKLTPENLLITLKSGKSGFGNDLGFDGLLCKKASKDFPLNCDVAAWKDIPSVRFPNRVQRGGAKSDAKDLDGWLKVAWTERGLNLLVKVVDDKFVHKATAKNGDRWENDSLQVYFDSLCEARWRQTNGYNDSEYDYAVFPSPDGKAAVSYRFRQPDPQLSGLVTAAPPNNALAPELPSAFKLDADGYVYQLFVPAKYLRPAKLEKGYALGFALLVNDRDDASPNGKRESGLSTTPPNTEPYNNPKQWPALLLWD